MTVRLPISGPEVDHDVANLEPLNSFSLAQILWREALRPHLISPVDFPSTATQSQGTAGELFTAREVARRNNPREDGLSRGTHLTARDWSGRVSEVLASPAHTTSVEAMKGARVRNWRARPTMSVTYGEKKRLVRIVAGPHREETRWAGRPKSAQVRFSLFLSYFSFLFFIFFSFFPNSNFHSNLNSKVVANLSSH